MSKEEIQSTLKHLPHKPGVYRYYAVDDMLLYIGKAKNLKNRVSSYFQSSKSHNARITLMVSQIDRIEYTLVDSEKESLILESNLIHSLQPKYNVLLKDDKNYVFVRITNDAIPTVQLVRRKYDPKSKYFGPYTKRSGIYETLRVLRQVFPYCQEKITRSRPCSYYGIKQCDGICAGFESLAGYNDRMIQIMKVLDGKTEEVEQWLRDKINDAIEHKQYDLAALWRDRILIMKDTIGSQNMILPFPEDINLLTLLVYKDPEGMLIGSIFVQFIKSGRVVNVLNSILSGSVDEELDVDITPAEIARNMATEFIARFLQSMSANQDFDAPFLIKAYVIKEYAMMSKTSTYTQFSSISKFIPLTQDDTKTIAEVSGVEVRQKYTHGKNSEQITDLLELNTLNAYNYLLRNKNQERLSLFEENNLFKNLLELKEILHLSRIPKRIECYDISHISGKFVYGSMVTFVDGRPAKKWYRLFKTKEQNNDFENLREVLLRRVKRYYSSLGTAHEKSWAKPDLIIIDGGKGQLSSVLDTISEINRESDSQNTCFDSELCSLAKREELVYKPYNSDPFVVEGGTRFMIQRIRDEAHRFAITNNRNARLRTIKKSRLDDVPGLGPKTKLKLLQVFGSMENIIDQMSKSDELIIETVGPKMAAILKKQFGI